MIDAWSQTTESGLPGPPEGTKLRLLEAAGEEFAAVGFQGATIRAIARRAGANLAAINYHFGDKEALYVQAVLHAHRCTVPRDPAPAEAEGDSRQQLRLWVGTMLGHVLEPGATSGWQQALLLREMIQPTVATDIVANEVIRPRFLSLRAIIRSIDPELDDRAVHAFVFSVVGQCLFYLTTREIAERLVGADELRRLDKAYLTDHISRLMLAGIESGRAEPGGRGQP